MCFVFVHTVEFDVIFFHQEASKVSSQMILNFEKANMYLLGFIFCFF